MNYVHYVILVLLVYVTYDKHIPSQIQVYVLWYYAHNVLLAVSILG